MNTRTYYVLHSPYPGGFWRGVEKCASTNHDTPILFNSADDARDFANTNQCDPYFQIMEVVVVFPDVGTRVVMRKEQP